MQELTCPCCGKVFKVVVDGGKTDKIVTIHCNKCDLDIEYTIIKNINTNVISSNL